jgi:hypothetical protein
MTPDCLEAAFYCSLLLLVLALASSQFVSRTEERDSMIKNTVVHFELNRGVAAIMKNRQDRFTSHPLLQKVKPISELPRVPLDSRTETAIGRLDELNEKRSTLGSDEPGERRIRTMLHAVACKKALFWLREFFSTCLAVDYRGYSLSWPALAGDDYIAAVKAKDHVALLILMYWGILIEKLGTEYWWARNFGKSLIEEVCEAIPDDAVDATVKEVILWAREQVSLGLDGVS